MIPQAWKENTPQIRRRAVFFLVVLALGVLQISDVLPTFFGIKYLPLLPLTVVLGMFEREVYGLYYGLYFNAVLYYGYIIIDFICYRVEDITCQW